MKTSAIMELTDLVGLSHERSMVKIVSSMVKERAEIVENISVLEDLAEKASPTISEIIVKRIDSLRKSKGES